jgi:phosphoribosyl-AMP cyclohydrolase
MGSNFINVTSMHVDCDGDSLIYLGVPDGPSCHTVRSLVDRMCQDSL